MKAQEWVASFLVSRLELVRALDKAKRGEAEARKELHVRASAWNALRAQLQRSTYQTNRIIRALEVDNARLDAEAKLWKDRFYAVAADFDEYAMRDRGVA